MFFLLRVLYSYFFGWKQLFHDAHGYNDYALAILNNADWLTNPEFHGHHRPCGYPIFLAMIYSIFDINNFYAVYIIQAILSTLTVYYIFKLSTSILTKHQSYVALFWSGFYFYYIWYTGMRTSWNQMNFRVELTHYKFHILPPFSPPLSSSPSSLESWFLTVVDSNP